MGASISRLYQTMLLPYMPMMIIMQKILMIIMMMMMRPLMIPDSQSSVVQSHDGP